MKIDNIKKKLKLLNQKNKYYILYIIMIEKIENTLREVLDNKIISTIIKIVLIGYSVYIAPKLSNELIVLFDNIFFKILVISLIFYISILDPTTSILLAIAFILSIYTINNIKLYDLLNISNKNSSIDQVINENTHNLKQPIEEALESEKSLESEESEESEEEIEEKDYNE